MTLKDQRILRLPSLLSGDQLFAHIQLQKILENGNRERAFAKSRIQSWLALITVVM